MDVSIALVENQGRYLFLQRLDGRWTFPSGKVEAGELLAKAAERETYEETGQIVQASKLLGRRKNNDTTLHYFLCRPVETRPLTFEQDKFSAVVWLSPDSILSLVGDTLFQQAKEVLLHTLKTEPEHKRHKNILVDNVLLLGGNAAFMDAQMAYLLRDKTKKLTFR